MVYFVLYLTCRSGYQSVGYWCSNNAHWWDLSIDLQTWVRLWSCWQPTQNSTQRHSRVPGTPTYEQLDVLFKVHEKYCLPFSVLICACFCAWQVELFEFHGEDITDDEDGGIIRRIIAKGEGYSKPNEGATVEGKHAHKQSAAVESEMS